VQFAVVWPLLVLLTLGIIQAGLWLHGRNVAHRAAAAAVDVARGSYGTPVEARRQAERLAAAGGLRSVTVDLSTGGAQVRATVSADAPTIVDIGAGRLRETASAPRERVTQP
jgi:Flp pilus assembly protein TadG